MKALRNTVNMDCLAVDVSSERICPVIDAALILVVSLCVAILRIMV